jgi:5-formyltetrahydrofolate cyclo-ligase
MEQTDKSSLRAHMSDSAATGMAPALPPGQLAELLRREPLYRQARQLFVAPAPLLNQIRINALLDNKTLVMPASGLKEGFFLLKPFVVPFKDLPFAVTPVGVKKHGQLLRVEELPELKVDLVVTDAVAVDNMGVLIGDGKGFCDLAVALLHAHEALAENLGVVAVLGGDNILGHGIKADPWDVQVDAAVTPDGMIPFAGFSSDPRCIHWEALSLDRIRRIDPLWKLYEKKRVENCEERE